MQTKETSNEMGWLSDQEQIQQSLNEDTHSLAIYQKVQTPTQTTSSYDTQHSQYRTSITELISEPIQESPYSMQNVYQSLYQLSDYLWNKKINGNYTQQSSNSTLDQTLDENSFDGYLLPIRDELSKYDKFRKAKFKEEEKFYNLLHNQHKSTPSQSQQKPSRNSQINNTHTLETQLIKCYQQVPFIFFEENFSLDFSNFYDKENRSKYKDNQKMKEVQEKMNDDLDLIQINLFGQIHRKFQDYFKAAANFDYLKDSISTQLLKLKESRQRMGKVQVQFVQKSQRLRRKIIERNNYQKLLKKLKIIKSLKKLPHIIQTILQSSLPYECLELLKTTKKSIAQVDDIQCVKKILSNIKSSQTIVQLGLNKRYTDQLYLYIEEAFIAIDFQSQFKKVSKDCPLIDDKEQNSTLNNFSRRSDNPLNENSFRANDRSGFFVLDQLGETRENTFAEKFLLKNVFAKRQQAKEYEIAMILLQSYEYVNFPVDVTKIKLSNGLRVICRKFQKDLINHVKNQLSKSTHSESNPMLNELHLDSEMFDHRMQSMGSVENSQNQEQKEDSPEMVRQYIDKVSVEFYTRHIKILNELFKESINRYLGYILTLVTQYEEKLHKEITQIDKKEKGAPNMQIASNSFENLSLKQPKSQSELDDLSLSKVISLEKSEKMSKMQSSHIKFKQIFTEQLSVLPSIFKIIEEKIKHFLTLKNMNTASPQQFFQWVSLVRFWQKWFDTLVEQSVLLNYNCTYFSSNTDVAQSTQLLALGQDMVGELISVVLENTKKSISAMNLKNLITQLTVSYLNSYASIISSELQQAIMDESWQSVEIPQEFSQVLNSILNKPSQNQNLSITILNSSTNQMSTSFTNKNSELELSQNFNSVASRFKFKILKNNILLQGQRYKLTVSFLLLCEFIEELVRVGKLFEGITGETDEQAIRESKYIKFILSHLYQKIYQLIESYNACTKEMILEKKALKMQKIKGNNIAVKHICLLSNCLTFLEKLTQEIPQKQLALILTKKDQQIQTLYVLTNHNILLIDKISSILNKKMEQLVAAFKTKQQQKTFSLFSLHQFVVQSNQGIVTLFLQITEIIDEYLDVDKCERVLKGPFQLFVQKYFKSIIAKGDKFAEQARILLQKMKFLKKYFKNEFVIMQREVQE